MTTANLPDIYQGDDYTATLSIDDGSGNPLNLQPYAIRAQMRTDMADKQPTVAAQFSVALDPVNVGWFTISLTSAQTTPLGGNYVWDCQLTDNSGVVQTVFQGIAPVQQEVTR